MAAAENLGAGEADAIALAVEIHADALVIDELRGRAVAQAAGLQVVRVLGVLLGAKALGYIDEIAPMARRLRDELNFWIGDRLLDQVLRQAGEA